MFSNHCAAVCCRLNEAPVKGFEKDVGSKTTMRITYPEGAIQKTERYESQSLFVLSAFKALDLKWLQHMVFSQSLVRQPKPSQHKNHTIHFDKIEYYFWGCILIEVCSKFGSLCHNVNFKR